MNSVKYTFMVVKSIPYNITCMNVTRNKNKVMSIIAFFLMKTGPGFDSTSPLITTCLRFKNEVSYDFVGIEPMPKKLMYVTSLGAGQFSISFC